MLILDPLTSISKTLHTHCPPTHTYTLSSSPPHPSQVHTVEDHYRSRIDTLLQENTALRRRLLLKTEEFSQYRSSVERSQRKTLNTFKEKVRGEMRRGR